MASRVKYNTVEYGNVQLGQAGSKFCAASTTITPDNGDFVKIVVFAAGDLTTVGTESAYPSLTAEAVAAGTVLHGRWNSITTGSGITLVAYNG